MALVTFSLLGSMGALDYCHLIDRVAGRDIDLLRQPDYTFRGSGNNASRFLVKLSPDAGLSERQEDFAHWNGSAWVIDGDGTLEVFDVLGRRLFAKEMTAGTQTHLRTDLFPGAGVYLLRLGDKTQKVSEPYLSRGSLWSQFNNISLIYIILIDYYLVTRSHSVAVYLLKVGTKWVHVPDCCLLQSICKNTTFFSIGRIFFFLE